MSRTSRAPVRASSATVASSRRARPARETSRRVLLVDGDPGLLRGISRLLLDDWFVTTAATASQASILLDAFRYHAVITDYETPGQDGIWLLHWARVRHPEVLRVLVSASEPALFAPHVLSGLIQYYLPKPVDRADLNEVLGA